MKNKKKGEMLGFLGIDKYDVLIYIALLLRARGHKVMVIDCSKTEALSHCIPIPSSLDPQLDIISYKGIDYATNRCGEELIYNYDYILIDFGFELDNNEIPKIKDLIIVTDRQLHNVHRLSKVINTRASLILRDIKPRKVNKEIIDIFIHKNISINKSYVLNFDEIDKKIMQDLQYKNRTQIKKMSFSIQVFLEAFAKDNLKIEGREYMAAYKQIKRGV